MYGIEIYYRTGNSLGSEDMTEELGYSFETKEEARLFLSYIKEHYQMYKEINDWRPYSERKNKEFTREAILERNKDKPWFYSDYPQQTIKYLDTHVSCFWTGYFETLYTAKVVLENTESDEDIFNA